MAPFYYQVDCLGERVKDVRCCHPGHARLDGSLRCALFFTDHTPGDSCQLTLRDPD